MIARRTAVVLTGRGGQGIQLCAKVLAEAAVLEGHHVMLTSYFGGEMRGGRTEATVVVDAAPIDDLPPIVPSVDGAIVVDPAFVDVIAPKLGPDALVLADETFAAELDLPGQVRALPARRTASELGAEVAAGLLLVGVYATLSGVAGPDALRAAVAALVPAHRAAALAADLAALDAADALCASTS